MPLYTNDPKPIPPRPAPTRTDNKREGKIKRRWFTFGCLTTFIFLIIISVSSVISLVKLGSKQVAPTIHPGTYLNIKLSGSLVEHKEVDEDLFSISDKTLSVRQLIDRIEHAAIDNNISGLILEPAAVSAGYATMSELIDAIELFKMSGKQVVAYLETAYNSDYFIASAADKICLVPSQSGGVYLSGIGISALYMKNFFDKLGIEINVLHSGNYKGAGENFNRNEMSTQMKETYNQLLDDIYFQMLTDISVRRKLNFGEIFNIYEKREELFINGDFAVESGIVDELCHRDRLIENLGLKEKQISSITKYDYKLPLVKRKDTIAVVYLQGNIGQSSSSFDTNVLSSKKVEKIIKEVKKDPSIKGIVLRVNSPGGSALESEKIYQFLVKELSDKPLIISMGDVAASGGYYISAPGDYVFADPYTLTGSIGVVSMLPNAHQAGKNIGFNVQSITRGKFSNFLNMWEKPNRVDLNAMQKNMDNVYLEFKDRVATGRQLSIDEVEKVAQGRTWSSRKALKNNLIDEVGSLNLAIARAAALAEVADYQVSYFPHTKSLIDLIIENKFDFLVLERIIKQKMIKDPAFERAYRLLEIMRNEPILMITPATVTD